MANIPDSSLGFLIENLKDLIKYKSDIIGGVKDNIEELRCDLEKLKDFISKYAQRESNSAALESLISQIKDVVYEAEDAIDTYIVHVSLRKRRNTVSKVIHALDDASELRHVTKKIEKVTKYVQDIYKNMVPLEIESMQLAEISSTGPERVKDLFGSKGGETKENILIGKTKSSPALLTQENSQEEKIIPRKTVMLEEDYVIGLEDASEELIKLIRDPVSKSLGLISIIGMFGLGKTTLARKIFNEPAVAYHFHLRAFVNVSQEYKRRELYLRILSSFGHVPEERKSMSDEYLVDLIWRNLKGKRYLIVLDDVWTKEVWDDLKSAFPDDHNSSRVVITSRNKSVALYANPEIGPFYLRFLNLEESRELLRRKIFGQNTCPPEIEDFELRILQRCGGLPLAIVVIAGILGNNRDRIDWWKKVSEGVTEFIASNKSQMVDVIKMSYSNLPHHLRPSFLYMGVFPEDYDIPVWKLLRLWIAEGFIESHQQMSLEDVAQNYLMELVDKNLVMVGSISWNRCIKTCRIHDTLRDFCKAEARKENIFHEINEFSRSSSTSLDTYRRICVNDSILDYMRSRPSGMHARSFLCFSKEEIPLPVEYVSSIPKAFKLLRVLEIRSIILTLFPPGLFQLILLKYIAICCHFEVIPEKMLDLWNLQTLIIETSSLILDIKADIWKMAHLRHLHTNASAYLHKSKDEPLINPNLQTLSTISPESCTKELFDICPNLKKLGIHGKLDCLFYADGKSSMFDSLSRLEELESLKLWNSDQSIKLQALPPPSMFPRNLKKLTLLNTSLDWVHMSTLGKLDRLEVLKLKGNAFQGERWQTEDAGFPNLRILHIGHTDLEVWEASADHFPKLESLFLLYCAKLVALPADFGDIVTLQEIKLYHTSPQLVSSARDIELNMLEMGAVDFKLFFYPPEQ